jgi:mannose-6-phosphate isomerase class I
MFKDLSHKYMDFEKELEVDEGGSLEISVVTEGDGLTSRQSQTLNVSEGDTVTITMETS